jgi:two-component system chemotaxis response regulator CheY
MNTDIAVLIVDDYPSMRRTIGDIMRRFGFSNLAYAEDGQMAWEMMQEYRYELVLLDLSMPRMSGFELLKLIRCPGGDLTDVAVLAITGEAEQDRVIEAVRGGVDNYIVKPFTPQTLERKLREVMSRRKKRA